MTIAELLAATGLTANDLVPIWDAEAAQNVEPTQKITAAQLAAAVKVLASLVNTTEMNAAIQQSTATGGSGYFKSPDGTLLQWGRSSIPAGSYVQPDPGVSMPVPFVDTNYTLIVRSMDDLYIGVDDANKYKQKFRAGRTPNTATNYFEWLAVGKWK